MYIKQSKIYIYILNKQSPEKKSLKLLAYPRNNITGFTFLTPLRKFCPQNFHILDFKKIRIMVLHERFRFPRHFFNHITFP